MSDNIPKSPLSGLTGRLKSAARFARDIYKRPEQGKNAFRARDIRFFLQFARPVYKIALLSFALSIIVSLLKSLIPLSTKIFIDFVIFKQAYSQVYPILSAVGLHGMAGSVVNVLQTIEYVLLIMIVGGLIYAALEAAKNYLTMRYELELTYNLQTSLFDHVLRYPVSYFKSQQSGYLVSRVAGDVYVLQVLLSSMITSLISNVFFLLFSVAFLVAINYKMALIVACMVPAYLLINLFFSGRIRAINRQEREAASQNLKSMQEALSGYELVKSHATEELESEKVSRGLRKYMNTRINNMIVSSTSGTLIKGVQYAAIVVVMWYGLHEVLNGSITVGDYVAFMSYLLLLSGSVSSLFNAYLNLQPVLASLDRVTELFKTGTEFEKDQKNQKGLKPDRIAGNIEYRGVSFSYEPDKPVLSNVNFKVGSGETIALVGLSGAGKTTLVNLLLRFYSPQAGAVYLDGIDIRELNTTWLRKEVGIVSQDVFLFDDTIENNIKYGRPAATLEEVIAVAKKAHIHEDIVKLPDGYNTLVGERGVKLSTGQRQRVSIARAFLRNTSILILDEPSSALDLETERKLKESLRELIRGKSAIIISHRESLLDIADKILVIRGGNMAEAGKSEELHRQEGLNSIFIE